MDYRELDRLISRLEVAVNDTNPQKGYWKELWELIKRVGGSFKETRYPTRQEKDNAWIHFQELVKKAKARSKEDRHQLEKDQHEWQSRQITSRRVAEEIKSIARSALPTTENERAIADIVFFPTKFFSSMFSKLTGDRTPSRSEEIREDLKERNERLHKAWTEFKDRKEELLPGDRKNTFDALRKVQACLDHAWSQWKQDTTDLRETKRREWEEKQQQRERKHQEWGQRQADRERRQREREQNQREWQAKQRESERDFAERVRARISNLEDKLEWAEGKLGKQQDHLTALRDRYSEARSDRFRDVVSGWIADCNSQIEDLQEKVSRYRHWIEEERRKLN